MAKPLSFIGVDLSQSRPPFTLALLDTRPRLLALEHFTLDETLDLILKQEAGWVAVNAPARLSAGLSLQPSPPPASAAGRSREMRLVEQELRQQGLTIHRTPSSLEDCPGWMRRGFQLYHRLAEHGFQPFPDAEASRQWMETIPEAAFHALVEQPLYECKSLEGRLQRQLILFEHGIRLPDPMDFFEEVTRFKLLHSTIPLNMIHPLPELNAVVAAYTAFLAGCKPEKTVRLGDPQEGQVTLPASQPAA